MFPQERVSVILQAPLCTAKRAYSFGAMAVMAWVVFGQDSGADSGQDTVLCPVILLQQENYPLELSHTHKGLAGLEFPVELAALFRNFVHLNNRVQPHR